MAQQDERCGFLIPNDAQLGDLTENTDLLAKPLRSTQDIRHLMFDSSDTTPDSTVEDPVELFYKDQRDNDINADGQDVVQYTAFDDSEHDMAPCSEGDIASHELYEQSSREGKHREHRRKLSRRRGDEATVDCLSGLALQRSDNNEDADAFKEQIQEARQLADKLKVERDAFGSHLSSSIQSSTSFWEKTKAIMHEEQINVEEMRDGKNKALNKFAEVPRALQQITDDRDNLHAQLNGAAELLAKERAICHDLEKGQVDATRELRKAVAEIASNMSTLLATNAMTNEAVNGTLQITDMMTNVHAVVMPLADSQLAISTALESLRGAISDFSKPCSEHADDENKDTTYAEIKALLETLQDNVDSQHNASLQEMKQGQVMGSLHGELQAYKTRATQLDEELAAARSGDPQVQELLAALHMAGNTCRTQDRLQAQLSDAYTEIKSLTAMSQQEGSNHSNAQVELSEVITLKAKLELDLVSFEHQFEEQQHRLQDQEARRIEAEGKLTLSIESMRLEFSDNEKQLRDKHKDQLDDLLMKHTSELLTLVTEKLNLLAKFDRTRAGFAKLMENNAQSQTASKDDLQKAYVDMAAKQQEIDRLGVLTDRLQSELTKESSTKCEHDALLLRMHQQGSEKAALLEEKHLWIEKKASFERLQLSNIEMQATNVMLQTRLLDREIELRELQNAHGELRIDHEITKMQDQTLVQTFHSATERLATRSTDLEAAHQTTESKQASLKNALDRPSQQSGANESLQKAISSRQDHMQISLAIKAGRDCEGIEAVNSQGLQDDLPHQRADDICDQVEAVTQEESNLAAFSGTASLSKSRKRADRVNNRVVEDSIERRQTRWDSNHRDTANAEYVAEKHDTLPKGRTEIGATNDRLQQFSNTAMIDSEDVLMRNGEKPQLMPVELENSQPADALPSFAAFNTRASALQASKSQSSRPASTKMEIEDMREEFGAIKTLIIAPETIPDTPKRKQAGLPFSHDVRKASASKRPNHRPNSSSKLIHPESQVSRSNASSRSVSMGSGLSSRGDETATEQDCLQLLQHQASSTDFNVQTRADRKLRAYHDPSVDAGTENETTVDLRLVARFQAGAKKRKADEATSQDGVPRQKQRALPGNTANKTRKSISTCEPSGQETASIGDLPKLADHSKPRQKSTSRMRTLSGVSTRMTRSSKKALTDELYNVRFSQELGRG